MTHGFWDGANCLRNLAGCGAVALACLGRAAEENLALIPDNPSLWDASLLWDTTLAVRAGLGYKDNVLLTPTPLHPVSSPFFRSGLEAFALRLPVDGLQMSFFLDAEDTRYLREVGVDGEQTVITGAQIKKSLGHGWQIGATASFSYIDQVQDISTENEIARARVQGFIVGLRPLVRRDLGANWSAQLELPVTRRYFKRPLDDDWRLGPKLSLTREYGAHSEVRLSYWGHSLLYDRRLATEANGAPIAGTKLRFWDQRVEAAWQHSWDKKHRWRTTTSLGLDRNQDNAAGFYDYQRYEAAEELRYQAGAWDIRGKLGYGYYDFPVRTVAGSSAKFHRGTLAADLRVERTLGRHLTLYGEYEYERSLSNEWFEEYTVQTVLAGLRWEF